MQPAQYVERQLSRLWWRFVILHLGRLVFFVGISAFAAFIGVSALLGWLAGAVVSTSMMITAWLVISLLAGACLIWAGAPFRTGRTERLAEMLGRVSPWLASAARSVSDFDGEQSNELVTAHSQEVRRALTRIDVRTVLPWRTPFPRKATLAASGLLIGAAVLLGLGTPHLGMYALTHRANQDIPVADFVQQVTWHCEYPTYLARPADIRHETSLTLPVGTAVRMEIETRLVVARLSVAIAEQELALERSTNEDRRWEAQFTVENSGIIRIEASDLNAVTLLDALPRNLDAVVDQPPVLSIRSGLLGSENGAETIQQDTRVMLPFTAEDDHGLRHVHLVVRTPDGEVIRREVFNADQDSFGLAGFAGHVGPMGLVSQTGIRRHQGTLSFDVSETDARPGDALFVWVEGRDNDDVSGPNIGRSEGIRLVLESASSQNGALMRALLDLVGLGLDALADRLETEAGDTLAQETRLSMVQASAAHYVAKLASIGADDPDGIDGSVLVAMAERLLRSLEQEQRRHARGISARAAQALDGEIVNTLETQVLFLQDLADRLRVDDAAQIALELDALRREMTSLLAELRRQPSPEARRQLMAAIQRAGARLRELQARMASLESSPSEFLNEVAGQQERSQSALSAFEEAVRGDDLERAERELMELEREITAMAASLSDNSTSFGESRMGPRERAMAEAMDRLAGLETEQRQLLGRTENTQRAAAQEALADQADEIAEVARGLEQRARASETALMQLDSNALGLYDRESRTRAIARLGDAAAALHAGDLAEAQRMAEAAEANAERLARELELSALLFGGRGRSGDAGGEALAQLARDAAKNAASLRRTLESAIPRLESYTQEAGRAQLDQDEARQGAAEEAATGLEELFRTEPGGAPLSPDGADTLQRVVGEMERAQDALGNGRVLDAAHAQREAARELSELRDRLEEQQQQQQQQSGSGGARSQHATVAIPGSSDRRPDHRRELLDAMQQAAPAGYESANRDYFEGLLR